MRHMNEAPVQFALFLDTQNLLHTSIPGLRKIIHRRMILIPEKEFKINIYLTLVFYSGP